MKSIVYPVLALLVTMAGCSSSSNSEKATAEARREGHDPLYSLTLMRQGSVMLQQGRYEEALDQFQTADQAAPGNATVHNMIGLCYFKLGDYGKARTEFDQSLDLAPSFTDARNNRGGVFLASGDYRLAEVDYVAVLADSTYPHRWQVYYNLGVVYLKQGRIAAAEENFRRVVTSPDPVFDAYLRLAEISELHDQPSVAIDLLEEARLKFPDRLEAAVELGRVLISQQRVDEGNSQLRMVIDSAPGSELATRARGLLQP